MSVRRKFRACAAAWVCRCVSTSEGVMTDVQARKKNLGGELLCYVW